MFSIPINVENISRNYQFFLTGAAKDQILVKGQSLEVQQNPKSKIKGKAITGIKAINSLSFNHMDSAIYLKTNHL
jgi:hypothetical protein